MATTTKTKPDPSQPDQATDPLEVATRKVADLTERLRAAQTEMDHHDIEPHRLKAAHDALPPARRAAEHAAWRQATFAANKAYEAARQERDALQNLMAEAGQALRRAQEAAARPPLNEARVHLAEQADVVVSLTEEHAALPGRHREAVQSADVAAMAAVEQRREELPRAQYAAQMGYLKRLEDVCILEADDLAVPQEMVEAVTLAEANLARAQERAAAARQAVAWRNADAADLRRRANEARRTRLQMAEERSRHLLAPVVRSLSHTSS